jgi:hypothetical protein
MQKVSWQKPVYVQESSIVTRIPVKVLNSTNTYQPQKVYKSNFIIRENNEEKYNTNNSKNIKLNDFSSINNYYTNNVNEDNCIEIPISRIIEKSNTNNYYAGESLAQIENLNSCVSIPVIFELNNKK